MKHIFGYSSILLLAIISSACSGGDAAGPSAPSAPTATSVLVTLPETIPLGTSVQATATATLSSGTSQQLTSGFLSDTPSVASVSDSGMVTAITTGRANIYVAFGGRQGLKQVRSIANFQGNWAGRYVLQNCTQSGIFLTLRACSSVTIGGSNPLTLVLTQSGETVSGRVAFGSLNSESITVPISGDSLSFVARLPGDPAIDVNMNLGQPAAGQINGNVLQTWRFATSVGQMQIAGVIANPLVKSSIERSFGFSAPSVTLNGLENRLHAIQ
jgi:hypothetical protein